MDYQIRLESFEGPFDLLLHLIEKQELDIYDIPIGQITDQYLDYLWAMDQLDLTIAGDFLVMGATLLSIKAKMLLPKPPIQTMEDEMEDPREELVIRLLEYQKFKAIIEELQIREMQQREVYEHPFNVENFLSGIKPPNPLRGIGAADLTAIYQEMLEVLTKVEPIHELYTEEYTVATQMELIGKLLSSKVEGLFFFELLSENLNITSIITTFLALLELIRLSKVEVYQEKPFGSIRVLWADNKL
ncbi:MAG: segregation/condensation protein A [Bacillota bacterium]